MVVLIIVTLQIWSSMERGCLDMWVDGNPVRVDGTTNTVDEKLAFEELDLSVASYYDGIE